MEARTQAWLDQERTRTAVNVRRHGWLIQYVGGACDRPGCGCSASSGPPFAYTVGLFGLDHPELLILGVDPGTAAGVLNDLGGRIRAGENLVPGRMVTFEDRPHRIVPEEVPNPGEIVFEANRFYRRRRDESVPVLQLSYDDIHGRFPWDDGYIAPELQPRPGTFQA